MPVTLSLARINRALGLIVLVLAALGLMSEILLSVFHADWAFGLVPLLNLSYETTLATWYVSVLWLACAVLLGVIARRESGRDAPSARHWTALALLCAFLSVNELVRFHELFNPALADPHDMDGLFLLSWVIPGGALAALFAVAYRDFFRQLPGRFQHSFLVAGGIYVGGALVCELALNLWYGAHGGGNLVFGLLNLAQVMLQILGATVFLSALLAYVGTEIGDVRMSLSVPKPRPAKAARPKRKPAVNSLTDTLKARYLLRYEPH